jgi:plasmid stabilization system protein ParE
MKNAKSQVKITANAERNLEEIERFLLEAGAPQAFDVLLDELSGNIIPNLERFPDMGRLFLNRSAHSVEVNVGQDRLELQLNSLGKNVALREYVFADCLLLYAQIDEVIHLLSIRHHRQLSFDFRALWDR